MATAALAQQDFSKVEVQATKLTDTLWMLTGAGGNMGLAAGEDAVFLIDDQYAPLTDKITAAIAKITPKPVSFVLNTHWHGDHTGGNENLGKQGVIVFAHENVRKRMSTEQFIEFLGSKVPPSPRVALPVVTFAQAVSFHLNGEEIRAFHVPHAHTDGDVMVHFPASDVIHMGDVYWSGMYPFIDTSSGGTITGTIAACDRALAIATDRTRIIPGHGPLSNRAELQAYRDMLATIASRIKKLLAEGRKVEEIVDADVSADFDERWGQRFIKGKKFVQMVATNLVKAAQ